ncbi:MAG: YetF domain-containing protein [Syntrophomonadaceae bacterium]
MLEFALRVAGMYFLALIMIRLLGKRALGELGPFDFVVMTGVGDTVISTALHRSIPYYEGIIVLATLAVLEYSMGYLGLKNGRLSNLITGVPVVLIDDGKIIRKNLAREKFNIDDLMQELRRQGVRNIKDVQKGILESCGGFSVILKPEKEAVSKEDLGITAPSDNHLLTTDQLSRAEIFAKMDQPEINQPEPTLTDRIRNIEQQLQRITALIENRSDR